MNKTDIINKVAESTGMTKASAERILNTFLYILREGLRQDEKVMLTGFGSFSMIERKAKTARNLQTGEAIKVPKSKKVKFTAAKKLKEEIL